jgi:thiol-disulfide isomerase/thioredoxin/outer membrane lipoprotein-sorting protein
MTAVFRLPLAGLAIASLLFSLGCQKTETGTADPKQVPGGAAEAIEKRPPVEKLTDARAVLERMVAAYRGASSYEDFGTIRLQAETDKGPTDKTANFAVTLARPNKLRMQFYETTVVCDGKQWYAYTERLPGQVVLRQAPARITMETVQADGLLGMGLNGFAGGSPQVPLLLTDDPLRAMLDGAVEVTLAEPAAIDAAECYRVRAKRPEGTVEYWIDQKTFVLRRAVLPTDELRRDLERDGHVKSVSVVADFVRARLNGEVDGKAFQFEVPAAAEKAKFFMQQGPVPLLGTKMPDFKLVDLQGKAVTLESLKGKVVVLDFWATSCEPCQMTLPNLDQIYQKYKDNGKVALFAVNLDPPDVSDKALEETFKQWKVTVPILRDPEQQLAKKLQVIGPPTTIFLGSNGVIQDCEMGGNANLVVTLPQKLNKLLAGEELAKEALAQLHQELKLYEKLIDDAFEGKAPEAAKAVIATQSQPKAFHLTPLWKSEDVRTMGNIMVLPGAAGSPRLLLIDGKSVIEIGSGGKIVATHKPELQPEELICNLRTAVGKDGKRVFAAFAPGHQRVHLFDENWKLLASYPEDALKNRHAGIHDVELGDLDGDGVVKAYIGYWGVVGMQAVALDGRRLWSNRSLGNVSKLVAGAPDPQGRRDLLCTNDTGSVAVIDAQGQLRTSISIPNCFLATIGAADPKGDGQLLWCAITPGQDGQTAAVGWNLKGEVLWTYPLPKGRPEQPIEPIVVGRVTVGGPCQWLLPGCDGSIHVLSADGKPVDQFNYGAMLGGMATAELDGKPVLIVSSESGLQAWRIEP